MEPNANDPNRTSGNDGSKFGAAVLNPDHAKSGMESAQEGLAKAKDAVESGVRTTQHAIGDTIDRAKEAASTVAHSVSDAATYVGQKAESATSSVGGAMENTGHYLKNDGLQHMTSDVAEMIRRNPVPAVLIGMGLGFLLAQATSRRAV